MNGPLFQNSTLLMSRGQENSPCGAEGEEKARFPQGREMLNSILISIFQ
jgi:hypothetical protein